MPWDEGLVNSLVYDRPDPSEGRVVSYATRDQRSADDRAAPGSERLRARSGGRRSHRDVRHDQRSRAPIRSRACVRYAAVRRSDDGRVGRRRHERHAPGLHAQPSRLRAAGVQPARHARLEVSLHGQRADDRADGGLGRDRPRLGIGRAAFAGHPRHAARRTGAEDRHAEHAVRRQGSLALGHSRQQSGVRLRASLADEEGRSRPRGAVSRAHRQGYSPSSGTRPDDRRCVTRHRAGSTGVHRAGVGGD